MILKMKYALAVFVLAAAIATPGCSSTPAGRYRDAVIVYDRSAAVVESLTRSGVIGRDELAQIKPFERAAFVSLMRIKSRVDAGQEITWGDIDDIDEALAAFAASLDTHSQETTDDD